MPMGQKLEGQKPLVEPKMMFDDTVEEDVRALLGGKCNSKTISLDRDSWIIVCETGWS